MHCVQVPLTGTTVANSFAYGSFVGDSFMYIFPTLCTVLWTIGGPSIVVL